MGAVGVYVNVNVCDPSCASSCVTASVYVRHVCCMWCITSHFSNIRASSPSFSSSSFPSSPRYEALVASGTLKRDEFSMCINYSGGTMYAEKESKRQRECDIVGMNLTVGMNRTHP